MEAGHRMAVQKVTNRGRDFGHVYKAQQLPDLFGLRVAGAG